jgi:hypothetical protein
VQRSSWTAGRRSRAWWRRSLASADAVDLRIIAELSARRTPLEPRTRRPDRADPRAVSSGWRATGSSSATPRSSTLRRWAAASKRSSTSISPARTERPSKRSRPPSPGSTRPSRYVACLACPTTCFAQTDQATRSRAGATTPPPAGLRRRRSVPHAATRSREIYRPSQAHDQRRPAASPSAENRRDTGSRRSVRLRRPRGTLTEASAFRAFRDGRRSIPDARSVVKRKRAASTPSWFVAVSPDHAGGRVSALKRDGDSPDEAGSSAPLSEVLGRSTMVVLMADLRPVQG